MRKRGARRERLNDFVDGRQVLGLEIYGEYYR